MVFRTIAHTHQSYYSNCKRKHHTFAILFGVRRMSKVDENFFIIILITYIFSFQVTVNKRTNQARSQIRAKENHKYIISLKHDEKHRRLCWKSFFGNQTNCLLGITRTCTCSSQYMVMINRLINSRHFLTQTVDQFQLLLENKTKRLQCYVS